jgi:hypothetical protein
MPAAAPARFKALQQGVRTAARWMHYAPDECGAPLCDAFSFFQHALVKLATNKLVSRTSSTTTTNSSSMMHADKVGSLAGLVASGGWHPPESYWQDGLQRSGARAQQWASLHTLFDTAGEMVCADGGSG